ncbi:calcyphosin-2 isoform X1 [Octopus bimaculoides]|nr:calcyphosin-2 isoform X1 [Octopus bimaculoides]
MNGRRFFSSVSTSPTVKTYLTLKYQESEGEIKRNLMDLKVFGSKASLQNCLPETPRSGFKTSTKQYNKKPRCYSACQKYPEENCRPECVPTLDLRYLQEPETKSKVSIDCYDLNLDNLSTSSSNRCLDNFTVRSNPHKHNSGVSSSPADVPTLDIQDSAREPNTKAKKNSVWDNAVIPEDLPKPSEKYKNLYNEYKEEMKSSYSKHKASSPVNNHSPSNENMAEKKQFSNTGMDDTLEQCISQLKFLSQMNSSKQSNMEELEESKKKEKLIETVMVDQLSRSVICDPEQDEHLNEPHSYVSHKPRGVNRFLHETSIKTRSTSTENLLSKRVKFGVRLLAHNDHDALRELMGFFFHVDNSLTIYEFRQFGKSAKALPFILRDVYPSPLRLGSQTSTKFYSLSNIYPGADLEISCHNQPCLPETLKKQSIVFFRVTDVDEQEKSKILLANVLPSDQKDVYTKMHVPKEKEEREKSLLFAKVQQIVCDKLKRRGVRTVTGLGQHYERLCQKSSAPQHFLGKSDLEEGLKVFHIELPQTSLDQLFSYLDSKGSGFVDYSLYMRAVIGEMNEYRKSFVRKAYRKMRGATKDCVNVGELKKFYRAGNQNNVFSGGELYDALQLMLSVLNKSSKETEVIRYIEWEQYYEGLSIGIESDVDFLRILKNLWSI